MAPLRIAVLECDTLALPNFLATHGNYTNVFQHLFARALPLLPSPPPEPPLLTRHHIVRPHKPEAQLPPAPCPERSYPALDAIDALVISGSRHNAWEDDAWILELIDYLRAALQNGRVRIIGVCFGHQVLARALGAVVRAAPVGWEVSVSDVELNDEGKRVFGLETMVRMCV